MRTPAVWAMSLATPTKNPITVLDLCSRWVYRQCCDNAGPVPSSIHEKVRKAARSAQIELELYMPSQSK